MREQCRKCLPSYFYVSSLLIAKKELSCFTEMVKLNRGKISFLNALFCFPFSFIDCVSLLYSLMMLYLIIMLVTVMEVVLN